MLTLRVFDNGHFRKEFYFFLFRNSLSVEGERVFWEREAKL